MQRPVHLILLPPLGTSGSYSASLMMVSCCFLERMLRLQNNILFACTRNNILFVCTLQTSPIRLIVSGRICHS